MGYALQKYPRESYVLATKVFFPMGDGPNDSGLSRKHIIEQCNASLKRLNVDYIDLYQCHRFDPETPLEETLRAMDDLIRQGKVLYIGVSKWSVSQIAEALQIQQELQFDRFVSNQPPYNMFTRDIEREIIPFCDQNGLGQIVYSPLAQGVLSGKYHDLDDVPKNSRAANADAKPFMQKYLTHHHLTKVNQLRPIAKKLNSSIAQLALAWVLRMNDVYLVNAIGRDYALKVYKCFERG